MGPKCREGVEGRAGRRHITQQEARHRIPAGNAQQPGVQVGKIKASGAVRLRLGRVVRVSEFPADVQRVLTLHPGEHVVPNPSGTPREKVGVPAVTAVLAEPETRLVGVAEHTVNFGDLAHAAVTGIVDLGRVVQETKGEMVKQVRPERVVPVEPRQLGVARDAGVIRVDHSRERMLRKREGAAIMMRNAYVIVVPDVLIASNVPLVGVGRQAAGQSNRRFVVGA